MLKLFFAGIIFTFIQFLLPLVKGFEPSRVFVPPSKKIKSITFGYDESMASMMWVRVLQDIEVCDQNQDGPNSSIVFRDDNTDVIDQILTNDRRPPRCKEGWVFQMIDVITDLSPKFRMAYYEGGTFLSILVDDRVGASKIYEKGLIRFPNDWDMLFRAAYHAFFETREPEKAADLLRRSAENGAPKWVYSLSAKLYTRVGKAFFAKTMLEAVLDRKEDGYGIDRVKAQLEAVNEVLATEAPR